ncbi:MAG: hypothetical protein IJZ93_03730 [Clostridia bacterium]|nr:hypothetical protein [Clostridia bacterium]
MKKLSILLLALITLFTFISCRSNESDDDGGITSADASESTLTESTELSSTHPEADDSSSDTGSSETETEDETSVETKNEPLSSSDTVLLPDQNSDKDTSNQDTSPALKPTAVKNEHYAKIDAGKYLGNDLPSSGDAFFKEIRSYEEFCSLVEFPDAIDSSVFDNSYVLVIKRIGSYFSDIGFKNYENIDSKATIILDSHEKKEGADVLATVYDYLIIPNSLLEQQFTSTSGELCIFENTHYYYDANLQKLDGDTDQNANMFFNDVSSANEYFASEGMSELKSSSYQNKSILVIYLNMPYEEFGASTGSSYLGFTDFHSSENDVYITLERRIVNDDYGSGFSPYAIIIPIDQSELCSDVSSGAVVHLLIKDIKCSGGEASDA